MAGPVAEVKRAHAALALALLACGTACSRKGTLEGTISVAGADPSAIAVRLLPEKDAAAWLAAKQDSARARRTELEAAFAQAGQEEDRTVRNYQGEYAAGHAASVTRDGVTVTADDSSAESGTHRYQYDPQQHAGAEAHGIAAGSLDEARQAYAQGKARFEGDKASLDQGLSAVRGGKEGAREALVAWEADSVSDFPPGGVTAYTDAAGHFKADLPGRGRFALVADGTFRMNGTVQHRAWAVWADLKGEPAGTITLDENNLMLQTPSEGLLR